MTEHNQDNTTQFPIRELSARTQVNTVTLRAWERRYGLLKPTRTAKGHRLYSEHDVQTIEKILALAARGVPLGKIKPLLLDDAPLATSEDEAENWQAAVQSLFAAAEAFSVNKIEHLIRDAYANYPAPICRERLIEPLFTELAQLDDAGAALGFTESELLRYTAVRLSAKVASKKGRNTLALVAGTQAPLWRLALMALELSDNEFAVHLVNRPFSVAAGIALAQRTADTYTVFYQDGVWKGKDQSLASAALVDNPRLLMCGTAAVLTAAQANERVFGDTSSCITGVLALSVAASTE